MVYQGQVMARDLSLRALGSLNVKSGPALEIDLGEMDQ